MLLLGSCHCGAVRKERQQPSPIPLRCYCSICRKKAGGGGYAINLAGDNATLKVEGEENITIYRAKIQNTEDSQPHQSQGERL